MNIVHNPHDNFFKDSLTNLKVAKEFFQQHLPLAVQQKLDLNSLELQASTYIDQALKHTASDILYKVNYLNDDLSAYLYILTEHQSSVDFHMPLRLLRYITSIWTEHLKKHKQDKLLPLVIPLVFYHGPEAYDGPKDIRELIRAPKELIDLFLFTPFNLVDTHMISDNELREKHWLGLMTYVMKHVYGREALNYVGNLVEFVKRLCQTTGSSHYCTSALYYFLTQTHTTDPGQLLETLTLGLAEEGTIMSTVAEYWTEKYKDTWVKTGIEQGIEQGESRVLIRQLELKFKRIPQHYKQKINHASSDDLLKWAEKVLYSNTIEEVFNVCDSKKNSFSIAHEYVE